MVGGGADGVVRRETESYKRPATNRSSPDSFANSSSHCDSLINISSHRSAIKLEACPKGRKETYSLYNSP